MVCFGHAGGAADPMQVLVSGQKRLQNMERKLGLPFWTPSYGGSVNSRLRLGNEGSSEVEDPDSHR